MHGAPYQSYVFLGMKPQKFYFPWLESILSATLHSQSSLYFRTKSTQNFKKNLISIFLKLFHNLGTEGTLLNSFWGHSHSDKPNHTKKECYRQISLMNIDNTQILTNGIQEHIKKIIPGDQVGFIPEMRGWLNILNWSM